MKLFKTSILLILLLSISFISCDRDNINDDITEEEALEIVKTSISSEAYGVTIQATDSFILDTEDNFNSETECGILKSRNVERSNFSNSNLTYNYSCSYVFSLVCENEEARAFDIEFEANGVYSSTRLESDDRVEYNGFLDNIGNSESFYLYSGNFTRIGTQTTRIAGRTKNFNSVLSFESNDVQIDKISRMILDGTTDFSFTGTLGSGDTFSYVGTINYNGNRSATVILNGVSYEVQL